MKIKICRVNNFVKYKYYQLLSTPCSSNRLYLYYYIVQCSH